MRIKKNIRSRQFLAIDVYFTYVCFCKMSKNFKMYELIQLKKKINKKNYIVHSNAGSAKN